jgi:hypothetical protein
MRLPIVAALALTAASSLAAQAVPDLSAVTPIAGDWTYSATVDGSEARFADPTNNPQIIIHCTRATRHVTISKPATAAVPAINVWTSSQTRSVPTSFNPATARLTLDLQAYDALLDAMSTSRGRIGLSVAAQPALVVPAWPEIARVVEDCRS